MQRCFFALSLADATADALMPAQAELAALLPQARCVPRANLHLTLKFLGDCSAAQLQALGQSLTSLPPIRSLAGAQVVGLGAFPEVHRPRSIYAHVQDPGGAVRALLTAIAGICAPLGFTPPVGLEPPVLHVTLARLRKKTTAGAELDTHLAAQADRSFGPLDAQVRLFESQQGAAGSRYVQL